MAGLVQKPIIQLAGFKQPEKGELTKLLTQLDCDYFHGHEYKQHCTHMIAKKPSRSEKILAACAAGKWVLTKDYISDSAKNGRWLNEIQYEWGYKIKNNTQLPIPMDSVPKIWREELARSGITGVFHNWKVVLRINDECRRACFKRVLHAGKATVYHRPRKCCQITHVFTESRNYTMEKLSNIYKAPCYPVEYIGQFIMQPVCSKISNPDLELSCMNIEDSDYMKSSSFLNSTFDDTQTLQPSFQERKDVKVVSSSNNQSDTLELRLRMCLSSPAAIQSKYVPSDIACCLHTSNARKHQIRVMFPGGTSNRIEGILEGQFYMEALKEMGFHLSSKFFPPAPLMQSFLQLILDGNVGLSYLHGFISIMQTLILNHPPWQHSSIVTYYMEILQCSICKKGSSFLFDSLARCCVYNEEPCHKPSSQELSLLEMKPLYRLVLRCYFDLFEAELEALNKSCYENKCSGSSLTIPHSVLAKIFMEYSDAMTNPVAALFDCVLQATRALVKKPNDKGIYETAYILHGILGVVVEYRLLLNRLRGKSLLGRTWDDLQYYIPICCQDCSQEEVEMMFKLIPSRWLQMFIANGLYKQTCLNNGIEISAKSFSLKEIISSYLIALGRLGSCSNVMKDLKGKKMGQWHSSEPLRPSAVLSGDMQKQVDELANPAKKYRPLLTKEFNCLDSKETKSEYNIIKMKGTVSLQQDCLGRMSLNYINSPKMKGDASVVNKVAKVENAELFGSFKDDINPTEFESGAYLWSMLLKNYIENHNLSLICHVVNDESLNAIQTLGKSKFENVVNSFPDQLMVQYAEDVKAYEELPNCIQQVLGILRNGSLAHGGQTELLLLHLESTLTNF
ncbi:SMC5-SMC6 complex localization factor protein 1 [Hypanus sabinus]|uniref:SMC5-SMC6 complex localization factor protein 1 n=1 Tax=Hypanus sabinus TaxID=79690 RepID=UPI0028C4FF46|nr:SMC5-SMC6 complex localization factor protein 1 [Hypanus sabinus]